MQSNCCSADLRRYQRQAQMADTLCELYKSLYM